MSRFAIFLLLIFSPIFAIQAQESALYTVPISDKYYAKIFREDSKVEHCAGWIGIYDKTNDKEMINQKTESIWLLRDPDDEDIIDLPVDMQDLILFEDVNFDGVPDFLLRDDKAGARTPSYKIYLANKDGSFVYSKDFSDLTHYYYGFFTIDLENKQIVVLDKADAEGLDSVLFFDVVDNMPRLRKTVADEYDKNLPFINQRTISTWNDQSEIVNSETFPIFSPINKGIDIVYSFYVEKEGVFILLLKTNDHKLYYVVNTENEDQIEGDKVQFYNELKFEDATNSPRNARYSTNKKEELISFDAQDGSTYELYNTPQSAGVRISSKDGKVTEMKGNTQYRENSSFSDILKDLNVKNIDI